MRADAYLVRRRKVWYALYLTADGRWAKESLRFAGPKAQALDKFSAWKATHLARLANGPQVSLRFAELAERISSER